MSFAIKCCVLLGKSPKFSRLWCVYLTNERTVWDSDNICTYYSHCTYGCTGGIVQHMISFSSRQPHFINGYPELPRRSLAPPTLVQRALGWRPIGPAHHSFLNINKFHFKTVTLPITTGVGRADSTGLGSAHMDSTVGPHRSV